MMKTFYRSGKKRDSTFSKNFLRPFLPQTFHRTPARKDSRKIWNWLWISKKIPKKTQELTGRRTAKNCLLRRELWMRRAGQTSGVRPLSGQMEVSRERERESYRSGFLFHPFPSKKIGTNKNRDFTIQSKRQSTKPSNNSPRILLNPLTWHC